jgi:hypothetical protein
MPEKYLAIFYVHAYNAIYGEQVFFQISDGTNIYLAGNYLRQGTLKSRYERVLYPE